MSKSIGLIVGVIAIVVVGFLVFSQQSTAPTTYTPPQENINNANNNLTIEQNGTTSPDVIVESVTYYTTDEVAKHSDASSCWTIIDDHVYDLTSWISQHPGGERAILSLCGHDGTTAFHNQHDDRQKQADILATFKIGELQK